MLIKRCFYGLGYGKDILVPFLSKHDQWKRKRYCFTYMDEKQTVSSFRQNQSVLKNENITGEKGEEVDLIVSSLQNLALM
jgi:hypothetical protein